MTTTVVPMMAAVSRFAAAIWGGIKFNFGTAGRALLLAGIPFHLVHKYAQSAKPTATA